MYLGLRGIFGGLAYPAILIWTVPKSRTPVVQNMYTYLFLQRSIIYSPGRFRRII